MELLTDVTCGDWLVARAGGFTTVGGAAGTGFEAYARILHPLTAFREDPGAADERGAEVTWRWAEVAERNGRVMHPLVQWFSLTDDEARMSWADGWRVDQSDEGFLEPSVLADLVARLAPATRTPDRLVAGIWNGWGEFHGPPVPYVGWQPRGTDPDPAALRLSDVRRMRAAHRDAVPRTLRRAARKGPFLRWPERDLILLSTTVAELSDPSWVRSAGLGWTPAEEPWPPDPGLTPQLLWPEDRAWVLASEIDWDSTIVAGSRELVDAVLADERFEAFPVHEDSDLTRDGDTVNR